MRSRPSFVTWLRSLSDILWRPHVRLEPLDPLALVVLQQQALTQGAQAFQALTLQCLRDLRVLLDAHRRGEPIDALKAASLAGLLSRRSIMGDVATRARVLVESGVVRGPTLADVERLPVIPLPAQREALRVLFAADELGAAVAFAGCPKKVAAALRHRMDEIMAVARQHNLFVVEDCAQAVGARYKGTPVGAIGDCGTFSFYPTKNLGACGEGGAFVSKHAPVMDKAQLLRVHGSPKRYAHTEVGFNFRMDGFQGAVLNIKLKKLAGWTARRRAIAARYRAGIKRSDVQLPVVPAYGESVWHQFTLLHPQRDALRVHLEKQGVGTEIIYPGPMHRQPCYASLGYAAGSLPIAEKTSAHCVSLPIFPELTDEQVDYVIKAVNSY